jgi:hypothetical protein
MPKKPPSNPQPAEQHPLDFKQVATLDVTRIKNAFQRLLEVLDDLHFDLERASDKLTDTMEALDDATNLLSAKLEAADKLLSEG